MSRSRSRRGERAKRRRCRRRNVRRDGARRSVAGRRTTTSDLGSPSRRGAIIRSSLIKLREMSKDSAMPARRTMRTQIITSHGRPVLLSSTSSTSFTSTCTRVHVSSVYIFCALVALDPSFSKSTSNQIHPVEIIYTSIHLPRWRRNKSSPSDDNNHNLFPSSSLLAFQMLSLENTAKEHRTYCCPVVMFRRTEIYNSPGHQFFFFFFRWNIEGKRMPTNLSFSQESGQVF